MARPSRDRTPRTDLALRQVSGNLTYTATHVTAWFRLAEQRWAFRPDPDRTALLASIAEQFAGLAGLRIHLRRTSRPYDADGWARALADRAQPLPAVPGAPSWHDQVTAARARLTGGGYAIGDTLLGVTFARRRLADTLTEAARRLARRGTGPGEIDGHTTRAAGFGELLAGTGLDAQPATPTEVAWLMYRSVGLGLTPPDHLPGDLEAGDIVALTEHVDMFRSRYGATVRAVNRLTGEQAYVAVLTVGRMDTLTIPEVHEPWLHLADRAPFDVEVSSRVDLLGPAASIPTLNRRLLMVRAQQREYAEHGLDEPVELQRVADRARQVEDQITTGRPVDASRAHGWHRLAVTAPTRDECLDRARYLTRLYRDEARITLCHPKDQDLLAREFIPGERLANTGYLRRMPVTLWAAALPQAASVVGDDRGDLIGDTAGTTRRPVLHDPHYATEVRERSGVTVLVAEPGGGKSTLMGAIGYLAAVRGVQVTLLDPSGPLAALTRMPALAGRARELNLAGSRPGTLAPYALIPTPTRATVGDDIDVLHPTAGHDVLDGAGQPYSRSTLAVMQGNARAERRMLVQDICMMLLPPQVARQADAVTVIRDGVRLVPAEETSTLEDVVGALYELGPAGEHVGRLLLDARDMPLAELFFGRPPAGVLADDTALTVITMAGLRLPDLDIEREYWSAEELLALPMLHTAHRLAVRRCYSGDMHRRKLVGLDEAHILQGWRSGHTFQTRLARDSRKWNLAALIASQNPADILRLDAVQNLVSTVFVGRIADDPDVAAEALRLLRVPVGVGYEQTLAALSQHTGDGRLGYREFVMRDVDGRVQKIRVDVSYVDGLLDHLDTTPTPADARPAALPAGRPGSPYLLAGAA